MMDTKASQRLNPRLAKFFVWGIPLVITASYCYLAFQPDLRLSIPEIIGATAVIMAALLTAVYISGDADTGWSARAIIIIAAGIRLIFLFRAPELSNDIYRYAWDGLTILNGQNPYSLAPAAARPFSAESAAILDRVSHPSLVTIYPPMAQIIFAVGAFLGGAAGIKGCLAALDVGACFVIMRILSTLDLPRSRAVIYAWGPLPVLEIASSGHIDGAAVFFLLSAFMLLISGDGWRFWAGAAFSLSVLTKIFPIVFLPALLIMAGKRGWSGFVIGGAVMSAALTLPFLPGIGNMFVTLDVYARNWEFAGFAYQSLTRIFSSGPIARLTLAVSFISISGVLYASLCRKMNGDASAAFNTAYFVALAFLLLTPTLHPWYALYLACLLPFAPGAAGLTLTWAVFLSYRVLIPFAIIGVWEEKDHVPAMICLSAIVAAVMTSFAGKGLDKDGSAVKSQS
jgi:hypothetical protein